MTPYRVLLADDHPLLLRGLADLVSIEPCFEVVGTAGSGRQALAMLQRIEPDIAILDIAMPDMNGLSVLRAIHRSPITTRAVFLTATITAPQISEALELGAWGILLKETAPEMLVECLLTVARGGRWLPQELMVMARADPIPLPAQFAELTPREREIVELVCRGLSNKSIASLIGAAEGTVKIHLHNIFRKLKLTNRTSLAALNFENVERS